MKAPPGLDDPISEKPDYSPLLKRLAHVAAHPDRELDTLQLVQFMTREALDLGATEKEIHNAIAVGRVTGEKAVPVRYIAAEGPDRVCLVVTLQSEEMAAVSERVTSLLSDRGFKVKGESISDVGFSYVGVFRAKPPPDAPRDWFMMLAGGGAYLRDPFGLENDFEIELGSIKNKTAYLRNHLRISTHEDPLQLVCRLKVKLSSQDKSRLSTLAKQVEKIPGVAAVHLGVE